MTAHAVPHRPSVWRIGLFYGLCGALLLGIVGASGEIYDELTTTPGGFRIDFPWWFFAVFGAGLGLAVMGTAGLVIGLMARFGVRPAILLAASAVLVPALWLVLYVCLEADVDDDFLYGALPASAVAGLAVGGLALYRGLLTGRRARAKAVP